MYQVLFALSGEEDETLVCLRIEAPDKLAALRELYRHYPEAHVRQILDVKKAAA